MDPFALLGLQRRYDLDSVELERRYRELQRTLHPDRHTHAPAAERRLMLQKAVEVNEAYRTLRDDQRRAEALLAVLGGAGQGQPGPSEPADPELLMEMMELRESLSDAKAQKNASEIGRLAERVSAEQAALRARLSREFAALSSSTNTPASLAAARALVHRLKYYQRFLDEVAVCEDEALS